MAALDGALALVQVDHVAVAVAQIWISMWRGSCTNFSMKMRSSPKLLRASFWQLEAFERFLVVEGHAQALAAAAGEALIITGIANALAISTACSGVMASL